MWWHGWKKDGKWMGTCWEMGSGWKIWKLDGHGQVSWWSLYCLAHFQMFLHMFALTSESPVFCSLSLSSQHILRGQLSDPRLIKQALILSSGAGYYWYHLPAYHAKIPATLQHISKRTWWGRSECDTRAANPSYTCKYCNPRWAGQYAVRNSIQKDPFATQTVQLPLLWSDTMSLRPQRPRYGDPCWEMGDPPMFCMFFRQGDKPWYFGGFRKALGVSTL